jgi:hypothetical protein
VPQRCLACMPVGAIMFATLLASGCVTGGRDRSSSSATPPGAVPAPSASQIPALFQQAPWSTTTDSEGQVVFLQKQVRLQFAPQAGESERRTIRIYDARRNDVGFFYGGQFPKAKARCIYGLSVYLYPATEPLSVHLDAVRAEIIRANPDAKNTKRVLNLDDDHGGNGVHAGYLNVINGLESFEGVSIYERGGWFIKYRTTMGPAEESACEQEVRTAVAAMQARKG